MEKVVVSIPAEPIAQGRPRLSSRGGFARAYDPPKSRSWKAFVADYASKAMQEAGIAELLEGPLSPSAFALHSHCQNHNIVNQASASTVAHEKARLWITSTRV